MFMPRSAGLAASLAEWRPVDLATWCSRYRYHWIGHRISFLSGKTDSVFDGQSTGARVPVPTRSHRIASQYAALALCPMRTRYHLPHLMVWMVRSSISEDSVTSDCVPFVDRIIYENSSEVRSNSASVIVSEDVHALSRCDTRTETLFS